MKLISRIQRKKESGKCLQGGILNKINRSVIDTGVGRISGFGIKGGW